MPSKNRKKYWRKIQKTEDAEEYLVTVNEEFKFGGPVTSRPDSELYAISKRPDQTTTPPRRIMKSWRPFYPDPLVKPLRGDAHSTDKKSIIRPVDAKTRKKALAIKQGRIQLRRGKKKAMARQWEMFTSPLWSEADVTPANNDTLDFTQHVTELVKPYIPRIPDTVLSGREERKSTPFLPAVMLPHPGVSYRPEEEEHERLMGRVREGAMRKKKAEQRLKHKLRGMKTMSRGEFRKEELRQMEEGLFGGGGGSESESEDDATRDTQPPKMKRKKNKRKGLALEKRKAEMELKSKKLQARQSHDIQNIKSLNRQLDRLSVVNKVRSVPLTKRLGRLRFREGRRDFQLSSQISSSLRELAPEGDLLRDRYKSLQRRNIIEVRRRRRMKRRYPLKAYVKNSHKD